jgi:transposase
MDLFYRELGPKKSRRIRVAVMDMWKAFQNSAARNAPLGSILFDKFHVMAHLGKALDEVRKSEYARLKGQERAYIKGQTSALARIDPALLSKTDPGILI